MDFKSSLLGTRREDESMRDYAARLGSRFSLGPMFVPKAFRGLADVYWRTDDLNARVAALEAEVSRLRAALEQRNE